MWERTTTCAAVGTPAAAMMGQVAEAVKEERLARLNALLDEQRMAFNAATAGRTVNVLFEKPGRVPGQIVGRSPFLQPVHVMGPPSLFGTIAPVSVEGTGAHSLFGSLAGGARAMAVRTA